MLLDSKIISLKSTSVFCSYLVEELQFLKNLYFLRYSNLFQIYLEINSRQDDSEKEDYRVDWAAC